MTTPPPAAAESPARSKREAILDAAVELFLEEGYGAASINRLIHRVGGSKSTVYAHFSSKEKLFEAVVEEVVGEVPDLIDREILAGCGLREGLEEIGERLLRLATSRRHLGLARIVIAEAERFPEIGRIYYLCGPEHILDVLAEFVEARAAAEGYHADSARELVEAFTGMVLHGPVYRGFCLGAPPPGDREIERMARRSTDLVLSAISRREPARGGVS